MEKMDGMEYSKYRIDSTSQNIFPLRRAIYGVVLMTRKIDSTFCLFLVHVVKMSSAIYGISEIYDIGTKIILLQ